MVMTRFKLVSQAFLLSLFLIFSFSLSLFLSFSVSLFLSRSFALSLFRSLFLLSSSSQPTSPPSSRRSSLKNPREVSDRRLKFLRAVSVDLNDNSPAATPSTSCNNLATDGVTRSAVIRRHETPFKSTPSAPFPQLR